MAGPVLTGRTPDRARLAVIAWVATVLWLLVCALGFFGMAGGEADLDPLRIMMVPVAIFGPIALVWMAALNAMRLAEIRRALAALTREAPGGAEGLAARIDALARVQQDILAVLDRDGRSEAEPTPAPGSPSAAAAPPAPAEEAPALPGVERAETTLDIATLIRALDFPSDADDRAGFRALRRAMDDHRGRQVVSAAQDLLTLLSESGLYMDEFDAAPAAPEVWRRFAAGARGPAVAALDGVGDEAAEERVAERLRADAVFRDCTHHFMRMFDRVLGEVEPRITDAELADLARTRSARAFMLLGRALGSFD